MAFLMSAVAMAPLKRLVQSGTDQAHSGLPVYNVEQRHFLTKVSCLLMKDTIIVIGVGLLAVFLYFYNNILYESLSILKYNVKGCVLYLSRPISILGYFVLHYISGNYCSFYSATII